MRKCGLFERFSDLLAYPPVSAGDATTAWSMLLHILAGDAPAGRRLAI
jgi:hypothetical protein